VESPGITFHAPGSAKEYEGMNPHTKGTPTLGVGVLMYFQRAIARVKIHYIEAFLISLEKSSNIDV
jgi:hypothetical protein